jgi:hypothetical protein
MSAPMSLDIVLDPRARPAMVERALSGAMGPRCDRFRVDLVTVDADGARWRVSGIPLPDERAAALVDGVMKAIADAGIAFGRSSTRQGAG